MFDRSGKPPMREISSFGTRIFSPSVPLPGTHQIFPSHRLAVLRFSGVVRGDDLFTALERTLTDKEWSSRYNGVIDVRESTEVDLGIDDVQRFVNLLTAHRHNLGKYTAVVVTRPLVQMAAVLYAAIARETLSNLHVEVFRDARSAAEWLGLGSHDIDYLLESGALAA